MNLVFLYLVFAMVISSSAHNLGGSVAHAEAGEYGKMDITLDTTSVLFDGINADEICWMSHRDYVEKSSRRFQSYCSY